jgi:hypothetical protein
VLTNGPPLESELCNRGKRLLTVMDMIKKSLPTVIVVLVVMAIVFRVGFLRRNVTGSAQ